MRDIIFRGKSGDKWLHWRFAPDGPIHYPVEPIINKSENTIQIHVNPKTVGQYTGTTDKNGAKIFEGDIVRGYFDDKNPEDGTNMLIEWDSENCRYIALQGELVDTFEREFAETLEVIGNKYDNPELF